VNRQTRAHSRAIARSKTWGDGTGLKRRLLIGVLVLVTVCVVSMAVLRLLQSLNDGTIDTWRLVLLFANAFGCATVFCALYARGRRPRQMRNMGRGRR
jgi:hypothetical protein